MGYLEVHYTKKGKLRASLFRMEKLIEIVKNVDVVVSGSVVDINRVAFGLGKKIVNLRIIYRLNPHSLYFNLN